RVPRLAASHFFFQAEDGIRDRNVTGVQTCALPIYPGLTPAIKDAYRAPYRGRDRRGGIGGFVADIPTTASHPSRDALRTDADNQIGRASCRERVERLVVAAT